MPGVFTDVRLDRAKRSSVAAADQAWVELYAELRRFAGGIASNDLDPDDLVQDALAKVLRSGVLDELDNPRAYLRQAILSLELSHRRRSGRWHQRAHRAPHLPSATSDRYPSDLAALGLLPPDDRVLLYLTAIEGRSYADAAELLGVKEQTLRARASKVRRRLRGLLEQAEPEPGG